MARSVIGACGLWLAVAVAVCAASVGRQEFELKEISGFEAGYDYRCSCSEEPDPNIRYPSFTSAKPLYGMLRADSEFGNPQTGTPYAFALDQSGGTGTGYDRLYIDRDGDLSNNEAVLPMQNVPDGAMDTGRNITQQVCFNYITFSSSEGAEVHSTQMRPGLTVWESGYTTLGFRSIRAFRGNIEIAGQRYEATMANVYPLGTRWDRPGTLLELRPLSRGVRQQHWTYSDRLMAMHKIKDKYWRLTTTPSGGRLFVEPYEGDLGVFRIGSGGRFLSRITFGGTLMGKDMTVMAGSTDPEARERRVKSCEVPVGDYTMGMLDIRYGPLAISLTENYHSDGSPRERGTDLRYPVRIRKNKPFVVDFSREPQVLFASPAQGQRLSPGEELKVMAVLVDPKFDIMIRGLNRKQFDPLSPTALTVLGIMAVGPFGIWVFSGKGRRRHRYLPYLSLIGVVLLAGYLGGMHWLNNLLYPDRGNLDHDDELKPVATISRADGSQVAEGVMPFG